MLTGVWLRSEKTAISTALFTLWLGKDFVFLSYIVCVHSAVTRTMTVTMVVRRPVHCAECAAVRRMNPAIRCTASSTPSCHGVCHTLAIVTITGPDSMAGWSGTASSVPQSLIPSPWANRFILLLLCNISSGVVHLKDWGEQEVAVFQLRSTEPQILDRGERSHGC